LPAASNKILTGKNVFALIPAPGTSMLNNLTSPGAIGPVGTVSQEKVPNKRIPPNKIIPNIDFIERTSFTNLPLSLFFSFPPLIDHPYLFQNFSLVNPSTLQPEGPGLLRVDPERGFSPPPQKARLGATDWVNLSFSPSKLLHNASAIELFITE
jgi:hypothetical protein